MSNSRSFHGLTVHVENPKGSLRCGAGPNGSWQTEMKHDYGDLMTGAVGADGDPLDVFLGPNDKAESVHVINQIDSATGAFDEHKCMLGWDCPHEAASAYLSNYEEGWKGLGSVATMTTPEFVHWTHTGDLTQPAPVKAEVSDAAPVQVLDALMVGQHQYEQIEMADAAPGKIRLRILANLANVRNANGRLFTPDYNREAARIADARCRELSIYGEEPHPPFDPNVAGGWKTDSTREVWKQLGWMCDAAANLWARVEIDERTPKGNRIGQKIRAKEKLGVSVRYEAEQLAPLQPLSDGTMAQVYTADSVRYCLPFVLDAVPNPAFTDAGRYMTDSTEAAIPMMDATADQPLCATPSEVSDATEPAPQDAAPEAIRPTTDAADAALSLKEDNAPPPTSGTGATHMAEETQTTGTDKDVVQAASVADAAQIAVIVAEQIAAATATQAQATADRKAVADLSDSIKAGQPDGYDLARFNDKQRERISLRVAKAANAADAKAALDAAIEDMDDLIAVATADSIGAESVKTGAEGKATETASERVHVVADESDKKIKQVQDSLDAAFDRVDRRVGRKHDPKLRASNKEAVDTFLAGVFGEGEIKNAEGETARRLLPQSAVADSANYVLASKEKKGTWNKRPVLQAMVDAKMVSAMMVSDAVINTANVLTQPVISQVIMRRMYQDLEALQYCEGFGAQSFTGAAGGPGAIGRALKLMTSYFTEPAHSMQGLRRGSLNVAEGAGIGKSGLVTGWQQFHVDSRSLSFDRSKEVEAAMAHGAIGYDLAAESMAENIAFFARDTDSLLYLEMASFSDEVGAVAMGSAETVASGNLKNGNVQDGIVYGATVTCIAQGNAGGAFSAAVATRNSDNSGNASTSNAYRVPVVMPRSRTTVDTYGVEGTTVDNPVLVKLGATTLTEGWLNRDGDIVGGDYAVDYPRGKFLFNTGSGVTASATTLTLKYSYSTNCTYTQINFGSDGFPGAIEAHDYYDRVLEKNDGIVAARSQYPVFARPDLILGTEVAMTPIKQSKLFYKLTSPNGTSLGITSDRTFAERDGITYAQTNAPSILDNQTLLLMQRGMTKYGVDTPFQIDGPHPSYDGSGLLKNETLYKGQELFVMASPHARKTDGTILNAKVTKHILY